MSDDAKQPKAQNSSEEPKSLSLPHIAQESPPIPLPPPAPPPQPTLSYIRGGLPAPLQVSPSNSSEVPIPVPKNEAKIPPETN